MNEFKRGTVVGTGAAINISCGFAPEWVRVFNLTDTAGACATVEWFKGMAAASAIKGLKIVDSGATGKASQAKITTLGISNFTGTAGLAGAGFTIGADTDLNVVGDTMVWVAARGGDGAQA